MTTPHPSETSHLETVILENDSLRAVIMPRAGAKIWQVTYKPLNTDLLWNNPHVPPSAYPLHTTYDDHWSGGWDELFPNDEGSEWQGHSLPDHGELWTGAWEAERFENGDANGLRLHFTTPITGFYVEKDIRLHGNRPVLEVRYKLQNVGGKKLPFLWKLHPAFAVSAAHRIDFPPMNVLREPEFPGTLGDAPLEFPWPMAPLKDGLLDLRKVPDVASKAVHFFYGTGFTSGWCGITDRSRKLAAGLHFDPQVFTSCWLFATFGGWRDLNVAVLEPSTGYPFQMKAMMENRQARYLAAGEALETTVLFSVREGITSIGAVHADGTIVPGHEG